MSAERTPRPRKRKSPESGEPKHVETVSLRIDPATGNMWYRGPDGSPIVLDQAGRDEQVRQQKGADPSEGFPKFDTLVGMEPIPTDGRAEPPSPEDAEPEPESDAARTDPKPKGPEESPDAKSLRRALHDRIKKIKERSRHDELFRMLKAAKDMDALRTAEKRITDVEQKTPAQPDARGIFNTEGQGTFKKIDGKFYIKRGNAVREARKEEVDAYEALRAEIEKEEKRKIDRDAPINQPNAIRDSRMEDLYEATGRDPNEFLDAVKRRAQQRIDEKRATDTDQRTDLVPEIHGPTSDDIPVEALDRHPILKGYYVDTYGKIISPEEMKARDARLTERRRIGAINNKEFVPPKADPLDIKINVNRTWDANVPRFYGITPRPIREILRTEEGQVGFAEVLRRLDGDHADEIMVKSKEGKTLTTYEENLLKYAAYEHARCAQQVEYIRVSMTKDDLDIVARFDERFKSLMIFNGSQRTMEVFRREIARTGMKNPGLLDQLQSAYDKLNRVRESHEYQAWQASVLEQSKETGVPLEHFGQVFGGLNPEKQAEVQRELERKNYAAKGTLGRMFDFGSSKRDAERAVQSAIYNAKRSGTSGSGAPREYGDAMRELSDVMKRTLEQEPVSSALQQEAFRNEEVLPMIDGGPQTFKDADKTQAQVQKDFTTELESLLKQKKNGRDFDHLTRPEREEMLAPLREHFQGEFSRPRRGWFARAFQKIFERLFNDKYAAAINRPVLA